LNVVAIALKSAVYFLKGAAHRALFTLATALAFVTAVNTATAAAPEAAAVGRNQTG